MTKVLRNDKDNWQKEKLKSCEENLQTGKVWKNILGWLNWSSASSPSKLLNDGNLETSPRKMAEIQNRYYIDKVHSIRCNLQSQNCRNPLDLLQQKLRGNQVSFSTKPITPDEVGKKISQLRNSKASGLDNLDTYIHKF